MASTRQQPDDDKPKSVHIEFKSSTGIEQFAAYRLGSYREGKVHTDRGRTIVAQRNKLFAVHGSLESGVLEAKCLGSNPGDEYAVKAEFSSSTGGEVDWADVRCTCQQFAKDNQVCKHILATLLLRLDAAAWKAAGGEAATAAAPPSALPTAREAAAAAAVSRAASAALRPPSAALAAAGGGGSLPRKRRMPNLAGPPPKAKAAKKASTAEPKAKPAKAAAAGTTGRPLPAMRMKGGQLLVDSDEDLVRQCHAALTTAAASAAAAAAAAAVAKPCISGPKAPASPASKSSRLQQPQPQQQEQPQPQQNGQQQQEQQQQAQAHNQPLQEQQVQRQQQQGQEQEDVVQQPQPAQTDQVATLSVQADGPSMFEMMFGADFMASIKPEPAPSAVVPQSMPPPAPANAHDTPMDPLAPAAAAGMAGGAGPSHEAQQGGAECCYPETGICDLTTQPLEGWEAAAAAEGAAVQSEMAGCGGRAQAATQPDSQQAGSKLSLRARLALGRKR
ncbi:hypothetical protein D9Q98_001748 [Chlorella vulgaris]|uniref:SWIM-type domain-containing protein n=1 Tax=Chlorella vulgaris TaxID=3077 RepID=A0A9D4Z005_CHLVU|nr:hypothetical protein D9Q98_001748 [Chlorella vulgaris]